MKEQLFIIYDGRARFLGPDEASVCCTAKTLKEARRDVRTMFPDGVIYQYDVEGNELVNERLAAVDPPPPAPESSSTRKS